jgi:hypothetical protein
LVKLTDFVGFFDHIARQVAEDKSGMSANPTQ